MEKNEAKDFAKLELLLSQHTNIVFDCDYFIDDGGTGIDIIDDDVIIDGNGHTIDARGQGHVFNVSGRNVTIKNITIRNAYRSDMNGSAINTKGKLTLINVKFINNICNNPPNSEEGFYGGGAVYNGGDLSIIDSKFLENEYKNMALYEFCGGGAILNEGNLGISNTHFISNKTARNGGAILNNGEVTLEVSKFLLNSAPLGAAISNYGSVKIFESKFMKNESEYMLYVYTSKNGEIVTEDCRFDGEIEGTFDYLATLIETEEEIVLDSDIVLDDDEKYEYEFGIKIDTDHLIIDGNGHCIDAKDMTIFFRIIRGDVVLRNITFKNAFAKIKRDFYNDPQPHNIITALPGCTLKIENCKFIGNECEYKNRLISNFTKLDIQNTQFIENRSINSLISNFGELTVGKCDFKNNDDIIINMWSDANPEKNSRYDRCISRISDSTFTDNAEVLFNNDELHVTGCKFKRNKIVLQNYESVNLIKSEFENNDSAEDTIISNKSNLNMNMCTFHNNAGLDLIDNKGNVKINDCEFRHNVNKDYLIINWNYLQIDKCIFDGNDCDTAIFNSIGDEKTVLYVNLSKFINNKTKNRTIMNNYKCSIIRSEFENNYGGDITNHDELKINDLKIKSDEETIFNGFIIRMPSQQDVIKNIENHGRIIVGNEDENEGNPGFGDLDNLISKSTDKKILLEDDIILKSSEFDFYEGGIELNVDGLVIDGQDHTIRGSGHSRMFIITAKDVTIKNLIFEDGFTFKNYENTMLGGGCIQINSMGSLMLENCKFVKNGCDKYGSAIHNYGKTTIKDAEFQDNKSEYGAICNTQRGILELKNCYFAENSGGAIENQGLMRACNCEFDSGYAVIHNEDYGIMEMHNSYVHDNSVTPIIENEPNGIMKMNEMLFEDNKSFSMLNRGTMKINNSKLCNNMSDNKIENYGKLKLNNTLFRCNKTDRLGMIVNIWAYLEIYDSKFIDNEAEEFGGLIANIGRAHAQNCEFQNNVSKSEGIINNQGQIKIAKCRFKNNAAERGGAIYNSRKANIKDTIFEANNSDNDGNSIYNNFQYDRLIDERKLDYHQQMSYLRPSLRIENSEFFNEFPIDEEMFSHNLMWVKVENCHYNNQKFSRDNIKQDYIPNSLRKFRG